MRGLLLILLLATVIAAPAAQRRHRVNHRRIPPAPRRAPARRVQAPPLTRGRWVTVDMWSGMGKKTTEPFTITGKKWRIAWSYTSGGFRRNLMEIILTRPGAGNMQDVALKIPNQDGSSDVIYETKTGRFILMMNCSNVDWNVSVEELRG